MEEGPRVVLVHLGQRLLERRRRLRLRAEDRVGEVARDRAPDRVGVLKERPRRARVEARLEVALLRVLLPLAVRRVRRPHARRLRELLLEDAMGFAVGLRERRRLPERLVVHHRAQVIEHARLRGEERSASGFFCAACAPAKPTALSHAWSAGPRR